MNKLCSKEMDPTKDGQTKKPVHVHYHGSGFLEGDGPNVFVTSSVEKLSVGENHGNIPTTEEYLESAYKSVEM